MQVLVAMNEERRANCVNLLKSIFLVSFLLFICLLCFTGGCSPKHFVKKNTDTSGLKKIAVMPFENFTGDEHAGERIRQIVLTELLSRDVDVIEPGEITRLCRELKVKSLATISVKELEEIGKTLDAPAVMMGAVETYGTGKGVSVSYPEVTINLRLIEVSSGNIVWSVRHTSGGPDFWTRHFGSEGMSLSEAAGKIVKEAIRTIY
jgi:TolB-like protein